MSLLVLLAYGIYRFDGSRNSLRQVFDSYLPLLRPVADRLGIDLETAGPVRLIEKALNAQHSTLLWWPLGVLAYGVLELVEAVGLWLMRRWGEYVAVVGTAVFIPLRGLRARRAGHLAAGRRVRAERLRGGLPALTKRLFGIRGGKEAFEAEREGVSLLEVERAAAGAERDRRAAGRPGRTSDAAARACAAEGAGDVAGEPDRVHAGLGGGGDVRPRSRRRRRTSSSGRPIRSPSRSKIAGSGLASRSAPDTTMSSKRPEEVEALASACGNSSSDQLVSANSGYAGRVQVAQHRDVVLDRPGEAEREVGAGRPRRAGASAGGCAPPRPPRRPSAPPASWRWFQARKSKSAAARKRVGLLVADPGRDGRVRVPADEHVAEVEHDGPVAYAIRLLLHTGSDRSPGVLGGVTGDQTGRRSSYAQRSEAGTKSRVRSPV